MPLLSSRPVGFLILCGCDEAGNSFGTNGQNAARPKAISSAGSNVIADRNAKTIPMAAIGPRLRFEFRSENSRHSSARMTVAAEAAIGAKADL